MSRQHIIAVLDFCPPIIPRWRFARAVFQSFLMMMMMLGVTDTLTK
jgi:hypothetical protein